ncbi:MAG: hypothetical protein ACOX4L_05980 [Bacillota bacterium]
MSYSAYGLENDRGLYGSGLVDVSYALEIYDDYINKQKEKWEDNINPEEQEKEINNKIDGKDTEGIIEILYGDDFNSAATIAVNTNIPVKINQAGDAEYYKFTAPTDGTYQIYITGKNDTYGTLYNSSQSLLSCENDNREGENFCITPNLTAGQLYYIKVSHHHTREIGSSYILRVNSSIMTTEYNYDANNRLIYIQLPSGTIINYQYDANGNLIGR